MFTSKFFIFLFLLAYCSLVEARRHYVEDSDELSKDQDRRLLFDNFMGQRRPCTPDCDSRLYPHCTPECKCDYDFARVQRFCNPPPLPMFLNTCRLWYNGCPKFEQYHYASQFMYSKAEKGKVMPGPKPIVDPQWAARHGLAIPPEIPQ